MCDARGGGIMVVLTDAVFGTYPLSDHPLLLQAEQLDDTPEAIRRHVYCVRVCVGGGRGEIDTTQGANPMEQQFELLHASTIYIHKVLVVYVSAVLVAAATHTGRRIRGGRCGGLV
jgi:hypothetical protein